MKNSFRTLYVWKLAVELAVRMVRLTERLVARRHLAIADQIMRAALSVPANIAEGEGRSTRKDRRHFLVQARGSLYELESHLEVVSQARLARDASGVHDVIAQIGAGLTRMIEFRDKASDV